MAEKRRPTRDQALRNAAEIHVEAKIRIETERQLAAHKNAPDAAATAIEGQ